MKMKLINSIILFICLVNTNAYSKPPNFLSAWYVFDSVDFASAFSSKPDKIELSTVDGDAYAYVSIEKNNKGGGISYIVLNIPSPKKMNEDNKFRLLVASAELEHSMKNSTTKLTKNWKFFGNNKRLFYEYSYIEQDVEVKKKGFLITNGKRFFNVNIQRVNQVANYEFSIKEKFFFNSFIMKK